VNQFAALVDFSYQYGTTYTFDSVLHTAVKKGNLAGLCDIFLYFSVVDARMLGRQALCSISTTQLSGCKPA
jgi:GH24 family phage-related lysozyme (muramidase)